MSARAPPAPPIDYVSLAAFLRALGYPARLELLDQLRYSRALADIRLTPRRAQPGENAAPAAAKQTVQAHLDKLIEADLVRVETAAATRATPRYEVNPLKLYGLTEELRRLSTMHAGRGSVGDETGTLGGSAAASDAEGPRLVLVHGAYEGKVFPLDRTTSRDGRWIIGRSRDVALSLDYDPYVSLENTLVARDEGGFAVTDLRGSKNGTSVNWQPLAKELPRKLRAGDVVGVGRSLLSFVPV